MASVAAPSATSTKSNRCGSTIFVSAARVARYAGNNNSATTLGRDRDHRDPSGAGHARVSGRYRIRCGCQSAPCSLRMNSS